MFNFFFFILNVIGRDELLKVYVVGGSNEVIVFFIMVCLLFVWKKRYCGINVVKRENIVVIVVSLDFEKNIDKKKFVGLEILEYYDKLCKVFIKLCML